MRITGSLLAIIDSRGWWQGVSQQQGHGTNSLPLSVKETVFAQRSRVIYDDTTTQYQRAAFLSGKAASLLSSRIFAIMSRKDSLSVVQRVRTSSTTAHQHKPRPPRRTGFVFSASVPRPNVPFGTGKRVLCSPPASTRLRATRGQGLRRAGASVPRLHLHCASGTAA